MTNTIIYKKSPYWKIFINDEQNLCIHAGADETYIIDEINKDEQELLLKNINSNNIENLLENGSSSVKAIIKKLIFAGVIIPFSDVYKQGTLRVGVICSSEVAGTQHYLKQTSEIAIVPLDEADIVIVFRLAGTMEDIFPLVKDLRIPHFFVDLAYHHTISFGPMVFPNVTACTNCLTGRIKERWGDAVAPEYARSRSREGLIAELLLDRLHEYSERKNMPMFINSVWSFDIDKLTSRYDTIFRLPWCTYCFPDRNPQNGGSFELPWAVKIDPSQK